MRDEGIHWTPANKSSGSRKMGWDILRTSLKGAVPNEDGTREFPGLFICDRCNWWLKLVPPMPRSDNDLDEIPDRYEDHAADMTRYRLSYNLPLMVSKWM